MIRKQKFATKTVFSILFAGALLTSMQSQGQVNVLPPIAAAGAEGLTTSLIVKNEAFRLYGEKKARYAERQAKLKMRCALLPIDLVCLAHLISLS